MNPKRLVLAIIVIFVGIFVTDILIHGVWLKSIYKETMSLWRSEPDMRAHLSWLMMGQFLAATTFVVLWAKGFADGACLRCAVAYGLFMGLFSQAGTFITFAVQPLPARLVTKWFIAGVAQGILMGLLVFFVYKPKPRLVGHESTDVR